MGILAVDMKSRGALHEDTLVATVMSNLGLIQAMEREGIKVKQTGVGTATCSRRCGPLAHPRW